MHVIKPPILEFISNFKRGFDAGLVEHIFTQGDCYHFSLILKSIYPEECTIMYSIILGHFFVRSLEGDFDITGKMDGGDKGCVVWDALFYDDPALYASVLRDCVYRIDYFPGIENKYCVEWGTQDGE
jgi:hypothetical protein